MPLLLKFIFAMLVFRSLRIGVARGGHGRANALLSLNFALPSKLFFYLKFNVLYIEELTWTCSVRIASTRPRTRQY